MLAKASFAASTEVKTLAEAPMENRCQLAAPVDGLAGSGDDGTPSGAPCMIEFGASQNTVRRERKLAAATR